MRHKLSSKKTEPRSSAALRAGVIAALARRDYSRQELLKKFSPVAETPDCLATVLDTLEQEGLLSDCRYAESVAHSRGKRFGTAKIRFELQQKGVSAASADQALQELQRTEPERLRQVWEKKFGTFPQSAEETARHHRFLLQRGFSSDLISSFLRSLKIR